MNYITAILILAFPLSLNATEVDQNTRNKGAKAITEVFDRLNAVFKEDHLTPLSFNSSNLSIFQPEDVNRKITVWRFRTRNVSLDFLPDTFELLSLSRNDIHFVQGPGYDEPPAPRWTAQQAIETAKNYVGAIFKGIPEDIGVPTAEYEAQMNLPQHSLVMKYYPGMWHVRWPRVDPQGHLFRIDSIYASISEDQGLFSASRNCFSIYQIPAGPLISQDEAEAVADSAARSLINKYFDGSFQLGSRKIVERIVNPNHILQAKTINDLANWDVVARLAWIIYYDLTMNGVSAPHHGLQVWVDAQTKEVVGGDFH